MKNLWVKCHGIDYITQFQVKAWRIVEAQHKSSTRKLVDTVEEHEILEEIIEESKPEILDNIFKGYNYLLFTPFRYPPLKYGSRFGKRHERSLWYGSLELYTALAEVAFYKFVFLFQTKADLGLIEVPHTAFTVPIKTKFGIDLTKLPFKKYKNKISSPSNYETSQELGTAMRESEIEAFLYFSARTLEAKKNVALFTPTAFDSKEPDPNFQTWHCVADNKTVDYIRQDIFGNLKFSFPIEYFMMDSVLKSKIFHLPSKS